MWSPRGESSRRGAASGMAEVEELARAAHRCDALEQQVEVRGLVDEIEPLAVDDQQRRRVVLVEIAAVARRPAARGTLRDRALEVDAAPAARARSASPPAPAGRSPGRAPASAASGAVDLLVQRVLVVGQVEPREQRVLVEQEIGHGGAAEHVALRQCRASGRRAGTGKTAASAARSAPCPGRSARRNGLSSASSSSRSRAEALGEPPREAGLAGADRPFDDDVAVFLEVHRRCMAPVSAATWARVRCDALAGARSAGSRRAARGRECRRRARFRPAAAARRRARACADAARSGRARAIRRRP